MIKKISGKNLPTTEGKVNTKKEFIKKYRKNNPQSRALEIANKVRTTPSYVNKVLSQARKPGNIIRGRNGRIFAHGKIFYEWAVTPNSVVNLKAPIINSRTGMKQVGFIDNKDPCSCQIHANGHLIVWPRLVGWSEWLVEAFVGYGWDRELAVLVVEQAKLNINVIEGGIKPGDPTFLPKDFILKTEWGVVLVRDDTPEKGVLELKFIVPDMQRYLGLPDIKKRLDVIEQSSLSQAKSLKVMESFLLSIKRLLQNQNLILKQIEEDSSV